MDVRIRQTWVSDWPLAHMASLVEENTTFGRSKYRRMLILGQLSGPDDSCGVCAATDPRTGTLGILATRARSES
jgi:hypothetical protein